MKNAEAINTGEMEPGTIGARAIDERTLEITLEQSTPYFLELLTHQTGLPVYPPAVEEHGDDFVRPENIVTNGAFTLVEVAPQAHILAEKNENYWNADEVQIGQIFYYPTEDRSAALRRFQAGELHVNNDVPTDQVAWMQENMPNEFMASPRLGTYYYALDHRDEVLSDPNVRQALSMAIDREFIVEEITGAGEIAAYSFVPPGTANYGEPAYADYMEMSIFDREEEAIRLMGEAGYGPDNPISLELRYNTSENHRKVRPGDRRHVGAAGRRGRTAQHRRGDPLRLSARRRRLPAGARRLDRGLQRPPELPVHGRERQRRLQLRQVRQSGVRRADGRGRGDHRSRRPGVRSLKQAEALFMRDLPFIPIYFYVNLELVSENIEGWEQNVQGRHRSQYVRIN